MDYEKAYKNALERARKINSGEGVSVPPDYSVCETIFPELKESEDERIRKWLIKLLSEMQYHHCDDEREMGNKALNWLEKQGEQKPIEQDTEINDLWVYIREWKDKFGRLPKDEDELAACIDYVMKRQKPAEWREEDEEMYQSILDDTVQKYLLDDNQFAWFKSIKDRVQPQPKQEWSEEDELMLTSIIQTLKLTNGAAQMKIDWLKSLKPRWKPTEEQMEALEHFVRSIGESGYASPYDNNTKRIYSLLNDLKSLQS